MKTRLALLWCLTGILFLGNFTSSGAQTNSWTNSVSGNWEDPNWSLGILPGTNQTVLLTNEGSKTLTIGLNTLQDHPATLNVDWIGISAPSGSSNTVFLDQIGVQNRLSVASLISVGSNSILRMQSSRASAGNILVGGDFDASDSVISTAMLAVGSTGPGVFSMMNSSLNGGYAEYIGGYGFPAVFSQNGGTNSGTLFVQSQGTYNHHGGILSGTAYIQTGGSYNYYGGALDAQGSVGAIVLSGGTLSQFGGTLNAALRFVYSESEYHLVSGVLSCSNLAVPEPSSDWRTHADGIIRQTGGTNLAGAITLGNSTGRGFYQLDGGVLTAAVLTLNWIPGINPGGGGSGGSFSQSGGFHTNSGIQIYGIYNSWSGRAIGASYNLKGGILATPSILLDYGSVIQSDGTNLCGNISFNDISSYVLSGGWLTAENIMVNSPNGPSYFGLSGLTQSGGTNQVGNLGLAASTYYWLSGGRFSAQNVGIFNSIFSHKGGVASVSGILNLGGGTWDEETSFQQFGQLLLNGSSSLQLPASNCVVQFAECSSMAWYTNAAFSIEHWHGSIYGGGNHRIIFGTNSFALTAQQLSQIQFQNPAGLPPTNYRARILATGEIVPDTGAPLLLQMNIAANSSNRAMQLLVEGDIGQSYSIEVSTDLLHWLTWTTQFNASGTISFNDDGTTNWPQRFYRAVVP
jgi:hypothetical protein